MLAFLYFLLKIYLLEIKMLPNTTESNKLRQSMSESFKNVPNLSMKGCTYDAPHLEKFISRPKTASTKANTPWYHAFANKINNTERKENIDALYTNEELLDISKLQGEK